MRILQISNRVPWPLTEGGTIGIYNFTKQFSLLDNEVTLFCLDGIKHQTPVKEAVNELEKYANVYIHPIDTSVKPLSALKALVRNESYNVVRFSNNEFASKLIEVLQDNTYDVVQLEGTFVGPYIDLVKKHSNALVSLRMHNAEFEIWERLALNAQNIFKKWYLKKLSKQLKAYEKELLGKVDCVIPVTDTDGEKFKALRNAIETKTIPAAVNLNTWKYAPSFDYTQWYHIGNMEWHANTEAVAWYLKDIHPKIAALDPDYQMHLAGKGLNATQYSIRAVKSYAVVNDAFAFMQPLDVCVVPLKSGSGIRIKILEAMAAGKLVISTTVGAQGIEYITGEHLLIADTPEEFLSIYQQLQKGKIDIKGIVKNARTLIEDKYSEEGLAKELLHYYTTLMA